MVSCQAVSRFLYSRGADSPAQPSLSEVWCIDCMLSADPVAPQVCFTSITAPAPCWPHIVSADAGSACC